MASKTSLKIFTIVFLASCFCFLASNFLLAEAPPKLINYQGKLTNPSGTPVTGNYSMAFTIYDAETGGSSQWTETQGSVSVNKGIFNVILGSNLEIPSSVFYSAQRWLGVKVGTDSEMIPRQKLTSVPYAYSADNLGGGAVIVDSATGNVGIGTTSPAFPLDIVSSEANMQYLQSSHTHGPSLHLKYTGTGGKDWFIQSTGSTAGEGIGKFVVGRHDPDGGPSITPLIITNDGNVGIGTTNPGQNLTVSGTIETTSGGVKFPDGTIQTTAAPSSVTLNTYDSGWFAVSVSSSYLKTHNLNTTKVIYTLYCATDSSGSNAISVVSSVGLSGASAGGQLQSLTATTVTIATAGNAIAQVFSSGSWTDRTSGYYKLIMIALE